MIRIRRIVRGTTVALVACALLSAALARADDDDEGDRPIAAPTRVTVIDGRRFIALDAATQVENGIVVAHPSPMQEPNTRTLSGTVLDTHALAQTRARYLAARTGTPALAPLILNGVKSRFGTALAQRLRTHPQDPIFDGDTALIALHARATPVRAWLDPAHRVRLVPVGAGPAPGTWLLQAPRHLASGEHVGVYVDAKAARVGVEVPASAVVWADAAPWIYLRREDRLFTRVRLATNATPLADGGYLTPALSRADEVVVQGAQRLLSEEFRASIESEG